MFCRLRMGAALFNFDKDNLRAVAHDQINLARFAAPPLCDQDVAAAFIKLGNLRLGRKASMIRSQPSVLFCSHFLPSSSAIWYTSRRAAP
jgi:hypothetical protein